MENLAVKEIMTTALVTIHTNEPVSRVAQIFNQHRFHHIPIVDCAGCIAGIISLSDFERIKNGQTLFRNPKIEAYDNALFQTMLAQDMMTRDVVELRPTDSIQRAYEIFRDNKFRALPVVEKGILRGIVTPLDILNHFFKN
ncbi:MAG: CBS domain-containing protein [Bacteroidota bacterium]